MKKLTIITLICLWVSSAFSQESAETFQLSTSQSGNKSYTAKEYIQLKPGFSYKAQDNNTFTGKVDPTILFPPTGNTYLDENGNIVSSPRDGGVVGNFSGSFSVSPSGGALYSVPIECLPGINGMQPNISLVYNSQGGNGIMGMCWNISGLSMISRAEKNYYYGGEKTGIIWDKTSPLMLDGQRFFSKGRQYEWGTDSIEYRTETGLDRIVGYDIKDFGPSYFKVYTTGGQILEYGDPNSIASYYPLKKDSEGYLYNLGWALIRISDNNGNFVEFNYETESNTCTRISSITYGNKSQSKKDVIGKIEFEYKQNQNPYTSYIAGESILNKYILDKIKVNDASNNIFREYCLDYSIKDCNYYLENILKKGNGETLLPIKFEWSSNSFSIERQLNLIFQLSDTILYRKGHLSSEGVFFGDIDGDGIQDIAMATKTSCSSCESGFKRFWFLYRNNGDGTTSLIHEEEIEDNKLMNTYIFMDNDNDGKDELYVGRAECSSSNSLLCYYVMKCYKYINNEVKHVVSKDIKLKIGNYQANDPYLYAVAADFEGIGTNQYMLFTEKNRFVQYYDSYGDKTSNFLIPHNDKSFKIYLTDINGNGKVELFHVCNQDKKGIFYEYDKKSNSFLTIGEIGNLNTFTPIYIGDFNGDGNSDLLINRQNKEYTLYTSTGSNEFRTDVINEYFSQRRYDSDSEIKAIDINQDGKTDLLFNIETDEGIYKTRVLISKGDAKFHSSIVNGASGYREILRLNSDRNTCILTSEGYSDPNRPMKYISINRQYTPNKIISIRNSFGSDINIEYAKQKSEFTSLLETIERGDGDCQYATSNLPPDFEVVSKVTGDNLDLEFVFNNPKTHKQGKGFLGFLQTGVQNNINSTIAITETKMDQVKYVVYPWKITHKSTENNALISEQTYSSNICSGNGYRFYWVQTDSITSIDHLKGLTSKQYFRNYNAWRNPCQIETNYGNGIYTLENITYTSGSHWAENKVKSKSITYHAPGEPNITRSQEFEYDSKDRLIKEISDPGDNKQVITSYGNYDKYGNPKTITVTAGNISRAKNFTYTTCGRFVKTETNHLNETTTYNYDLPKALLTSETNRKGTINYEYDSFGRLKLTRYPDGRKTAQVLQWAGNDGPSEAKYYSYSESSGESPVKVWYDASGKELRSEAYGLNKRKIWVDTKYDSKNRVIEVSKPYYFPEETKTFAAKYSYDNYGRTDTIVTPMGTTIYTYIGLTTRVSTPEGTEESTVNNAGWTVSQKTNNKEVRFTHYANGQVKTATPMGTGNVPLPSIRMEYDLQGNRTKIIDPDAGTITTAFDAWGQLVQEKQYVHYQEKPTIISPLSDRLNPGGGTIIGPPIITDPVEQIPQKVMVTTSYEYYPSGLMKKKTRNGENTLYEYDNYHRLKRINIGLKHSMGFTYDNYDRITTVRDTVDNNKIFIRNTGYDALGRVSKETYPGGFWVSNQYDTYGNLLSVNSMHGHKLWEAEDANAQGQITKSKTGNKQTVYIYNAKNMLESIKSDGIIDLTYEYKSDGNMGKRMDKINTVGDEFAYDPLKRLSKWYVGKNVSSPSVYSISYDPTTGNITDKYLAGYNMQYGENNKPPHALTSMRSESDDYLPIQYIKYTDFKKVKEISQNGNKLTLQYGVDEQRVKTVYTPAVGSSLTRYYMGNYEEEIRGTSTRKINYINGGNGLAAIYIQNNGKDSIYYAHTDFQGNLIALCKENGTVAERYAYDPWGRRVNPSDWREEDTRTGYIINRGYTMHEHLDQFGLINMNGRVYDPRLGMFLSPDPYVQAPGNWLNYNRYSYCLNNPLRYTDPSGETILGSILLGAMANLVFQGFSGKIDNTGDFYKAMLIGGAAGAAGWGVGQAILPTLTSSGFSGGVVLGSATSPVSGFITGAGNAWANGASFGSGLATGILAAGKGFFTGAITSGISMGILATAHGGNFWDGKIVSEQVAGSTILTNEHISNAKYYKNSGLTVEENDRVLKEMLMNEYNVKEGTFNISKITTNAPQGYGMTSDGYYVNRRGNIVLGATARYFMLPKSTLHITPKLVYGDIVAFKATAGHELIHAFHHYTLPFGYNKAYSERVAYKYTVSVYNSNNQYGKAFSTMIGASKTFGYGHSFWGWYPSQFAIPFYYNFAF